MIVESALTILAAGLLCYLAQLMIPNPKAAQVLQVVIVVGTALALFRNIPRASTHQAELKLPTVSLSD